MRFPRITDKYIPSSSSSFSPSTGSKSSPSESSCNTHSWLDYLLTQTYHCVHYYSSTWKTSHSLSFKYFTQKKLSPFNFTYIALIAIFHWTMNFILFCWISNHCASILILILAVTIVINLRNWSLAFSFKIDLSNIHSFAFLKKKY